MKTMTDLGTYWNHM